MSRKRVDKSSFDYDSMVTYTMFSEKLVDEDNGEYLTYGIRARDWEGKSITLRDISTSLFDVEKIMTTLQNNKVSLRHFKDVVEDFVN